MMTFVADSGVEWTAPALNNASSISLEFTMDFCGYCEKYGEGEFNPIDSFHYKCVFLCILVTMIYCLE